MSVSATTTMLTGCAEVLTHSAGGAADASAGLGGDVAVAFSVGLVSAVSPSGGSDASDFSAAGVLAGSGFGGPSGKAVSTMPVTWAARI